MSDNVRRIRTCAENWPEAQSGEYNPRCCRFPKSCSCTSYNPDTIKDEDLEPMTTQPAGEHHTGTLDLTGEGNAPGSPISAEAVDKATGVYGGPGWKMRAALEAAYPAIRQQVAEEIAAAIEVSRSRITEGRPGWVYFSEAIDIAKRIGGEA